jgi:hypothetical protein
MNFDYSNGHILSRSTTSQRASPRKYYIQENEPTYYKSFTQRPYIEEIIEEPRYIIEDSQKDSYYLRMENDELTNSLFQEKRALREVTSLYNLRNSELKTLKLENISKDREINMLKSKVSDVDIKNKEQSEMINSLHKEIDKLRQLLKEVEIKNEVSKQNIIEDNEKTMMKGSINVKNNKASMNSMNKGRDSYMKIRGNSVNEKKNVNSIGINRNNSNNKGKVVGGNLNKKK